MSRVCYHRSMTPRHGRSPLLALALALCVSLSHLYGAWHGVAHFERTICAESSSIEGANGEGSHPHSAHTCVSLDGLCSGLTPVSFGLSCPTVSFRDVLSAAMLTAPHVQLAWLRPSARDPPGISIA